MAKQALRIKDHKPHKEHLARTGKRKRIVRKFKKRTFDSLSDTERVELLKAVALSLHLIKEDD